MASRKLVPPRLTVGPLSGSIFVVTHGKVYGYDDEGRALIESDTKHDVTDQFNALVAEHRSRPWEDEEAVERTAKLLYEADVAELWAKADVDSRESYTELAQAALRAAGGGEETDG